MSDFRSIIVNAILFTAFTLIHYCDNHSYTARDSSKKQFRILQAMIETWPVLVAVHTCITVSIQWGVDIWLCVNSYWQFDNGVVLIWCYLVCPLCTGDIVACPLSRVVRSDHSRNSEQRLPQQPRLKVVSSAKVCITTILVLCIHFKDENIIIGQLHSNLLCDTALLCVVAVNT